MLCDRNRLGVWRWDTIVPATAPVVSGTYLKDSVLVGSRSYELSNHLGNVLSTISDKKVGRDSSGVVNYYLAEVLSQTDYYPFGMQMPGRTTASASYRYGFNGKENDNEVKGEGRFQDYGMRSYDPLTGRFISVDPLTKSYPWYSPYQFAGNKPIWATDLDGLEENTTSTYVKKPVVILSKPTFAGVITVTDATTQSAHKTFSGNYAQLKKTDAAAASAVNQLTGSNTGTASSRLDITMTGTRSQISKSWKGTDIKYFTQFSYSFTSNNVTEQGTFEMQSAQIQASARLWDPVTFLLLNKVVSSVVINAARIGGAAATEEMMTLYRSVSKAEAEGIRNTQQLSLAEGAMEVKQFWQTKEGLTKFNNAGFGGGYTLEIQVPKSMVGQGKIFNTATQVDEFFGPTATVEGSQLNAASQTIRTFKLTQVKQ